MGWALPAHDEGGVRLEIETRFPLGVYYAQSASGFDVPEWPPNPVRVIAALIAAAATLPEHEAALAREAIDLLSACDLPLLIVAPRLEREMGGPRADGVAVVAPFRGASQWAPRNHELSEIKAGIHPRDLGRGRARVHKGGVAIGEAPVVFSWAIELDGPRAAALGRAADEVTVLGTSRSPVLMRVRRAERVPDAREVWAPSSVSSSEAVEVRVPTPELPLTLDEWHARRAELVKRNGAPSRSRLITPVSIGRSVPYLHGADTPAPPAYDPRWWGDMLVVAVDRESAIRPKGPVAFVFARATRAALLARYASAGSPGEAPSALRARGADPHAAFVPLPFVGHPRADGRLLGIAVVLPHSRRLSDAALQRRSVEHGLRELIAGAGRTTVGVPAVGDVLLGPIPSGATALLTLRDARWRQTSEQWSTVTPIVHSRHRRNARPESLLDQVTADCQDVGLPAPRAVEVRRTSRFAAAPAGISARAIPDAWRSSLKGPVDHLDIEFDRPVVGPILLGKARHFGLGLCLPSAEGEVR